MKVATLFLILIFSGCAPHYFAAPVYVPTLQKSGDAELLVGCYELGPQVAGAYSPMNHVAVQADGQIGNYFSDQTSTHFDRQWSWDAGVSWYGNFSSTGYCSLAATYGRGAHFMEDTVSEWDFDYSIRSYERATYTFSRYSLQGSIYWIIPVSSVSLCFGAAFRESALAMSDLDRIKVDVSFPRSSIDTLERLTGQRQAETGSMILLTGVRLSSMPVEIRSSVQFNGVRGPFDMRLFPIGWQFGIAWRI